MSEKWLMTGHCFTMAFQSRSEPIIDWPPFSEQSAIFPWFDSIAPRPSSKENKSRYNCVTYIVLYDVIFIHNNAFNPIFLRPKYHKIVFSTNRQRVRFFTWQRWENQSVLFIFVFMQTWYCVRSEKCNILFAVVFWHLREHISCFSCDLSLTLASICVFISCGRSLTLASICLLFYLLPVFDADVNMFVILPVAGFWHWRQYVCCLSCSRSLTLASFFSPVSGLAVL